MMQYKLFTKISPQYNNSGFVNNINLSNFQSESLQIPGFGKIATNNTFYLPLHGAVSSPYLQNKLVNENVKKTIKMEVDNLPEAMPKSQTGFGTSKVLEFLNQGQKHKLGDNVYSAMTSPVIKIKKTKFDPSIVKPATALVKTKTNETPKAQVGKGKKNQSHKFKVI
jgi:hypothetical protein